MTQLTLESMRQYKDLGVFIESGGIEVARGEERMQELQRRVSSAISWGIEPVSIITPQDVKELVPYINEELIVGGFYTPGAGVVDSLRAATIMRERAQEAGLTVSANTEVLGFDVVGGRIRGVRTTKGDIEADRVVIACGCWSPKLAQDGRSVDSDRPVGASDDRHRPGAALRRCQGDDRVPDHP